MPVFLAQAYLCLDCEAIGAYTRTCTICGSRALVPMAKWLGTVTRHDSR